MTANLTFTKDTQRRLHDGESVFFNEASGDYYDSKLRLIIDCLKAGMTKEEIKEACDVDSDETEAGYIFYTTFTEDQIETVMTDEGYFYSETYGEECIMERLERQHNS